VPFDSLLGSGGGVVIQPPSEVADVWGYPASYVASAGVQLLAAPFVWLARRTEKDGSTTEPST
jgi:hypothetical protein